MIDTLKYTKDLEAVGVSREQAETQIGIMADAINKNLVTKNDFKQGVDGLRSEIRLDFENFKAELRQDMAAFKTEVRQEIALIRKDMENFKLEIGHKLNTLENRLTIKLGTFMVICFGISLTIISFMLKK